MARRRNEQARVLGPYANRGGFRVILVREDGTRESFFDATRVAADERIRQLTQACKVGERTIRDAMKEYEVYLLEDKGNKANSVDQTLRKLRRFFPDVELALAALDPATCARYYESLRRSKRIPPRRANGTPGTTFARKTTAPLRCTATTEAFVKPPGSCAIPSLPNDRSSVPAPDRSSASGRSPTMIRRVWTSVRAPIGTPSYDCR